VENVVFPDLLAFIPGLAARDRQQAVCAARAQAMTSSRQLCVGSTVSRRPRGQWLDEQEALIVRTMPLSSVSDLLMSSELGELTAVAGIGLALARPQSSAIT